MNNTTTLLNNTTNTLPLTQQTGEATQNNASPALGTSDIISIVSLVFTAILTVIGLAIAWRQWRDPIKEFFRREKNKRKSVIGSRGIGKKREFVQMELDQLAKSKKAGNQMVREVNENNESIELEEIIE